MVRKQKPKTHCCRKTISSHYTTPEGSLGDEWQVLHFFLVSLDHRWKRLRHVIGMTVQKCITQENKITDINLPQIDFWKQKQLDAGKRNQILFYRHVSAQLNGWTRTTDQTRTIHRKTEKAENCKGGNWLWYSQIGDAHAWWLQGFVWQNRHC